MTFETSIDAQLRYVSMPIGLFQRLHASFAEFANKDLSNR
jgi:hypothetical protein